MFGMGFMEILLIAIIAIVALGPDKLPNAMVEVAKFLKKFKSGVEDAKSTLDNELNITEMKDEANKFKAQIENAKSSVTNFDEFDLGVKDILDDDKNSKPEKKKEKVAFKQKDKNSDENILEQEVVEKEEKVNASDKFKVKRKPKKEEEA